MLLYVSMVLGFVLIIVLLAVPQLGFIKRHVVRWEVENMRSFITYAYRLALATGQDQTIHFDVAKNKIYGAGREYQLARGTIFGIMPGVQGPPAAPHKLLTSPITFQDNKIVCYAQGTLDAGTVYITDDKASWLYAISLGVSPLSYVRTYFFDGSWKRCV